MTYKTFSHHPESYYSDYIYSTSTWSKRSGYLNSEIKNQNRVTESLNWAVPRKIWNLVQIIGYDGQDDDDDSVKGPSHIWSQGSLPALSRRPRSQHLFCSKQYLKNVTLSKSSDRFLPARTSSEIVIERFRANKDPQKLSFDEKLTRNQSSNLDAFGLRRRTTSHLTAPTRPSPQRVVLGDRSGTGGSVLALQRSNTEPNGERQVSIGTVWRVGGLAPTNETPDGRVGYAGSGSNAPLYTTSFSTRPKVENDAESLENRLAEALNLDRATRIFDCRYLISQGLSLKNTSWNQHECQWNSTESTLKEIKSEELRNLPLAPFKVLDAPNLRDDFYCSVLAYSVTCHTLAVALGPLLYAWSEVRGVHLLNSGPSSGSWLTSLSFSSSVGKKCILGFGRSDGTLSLMSPNDGMLPRFEVQQPFPIACLTWRPQVTTRPSKSPVSPGVNVKTEDLLVGDETGHVYYYSIEWPDCWEVARNGWSGSMTLLARISVHSQQICGLSFSTDGSMFATGGNDNLCCLFQTNTLRQATHVIQTEDEINIVDGQRNGFKEIRAGSEKHRWVHGAAVKAIAFCPWKQGLLATGGGSNDKCIHFYHATSGSCLATISVSAQVTSLIWSNTRREICATFGYAQPEHPYRIAVFSWPDCKQISAIPWEGEHRALYAIPYHGGPTESHTRGESGSGISRTAQEGCIVVASSDESVKFHEVWAGNKKTTATVKGLLGGSDVIEGLESIDKEGDIIR